VAVLVNHGASLSKKKKRATCLHWAFYYGNLNLIEFIMEKSWAILFSQDELGNYPIDYLFLDKKEDILK